MSVSTHIEGVKGIDHRPQEPGFQATASPPEPKRDPGPSARINTGVTLASLACPGHGFRTAKMTRHQCLTHMSRNNLARKPAPFACFPSGISREIGNQQGTRILPDRTAAAPADPSSMPSRNSQKSPCGIGDTSGQTAIFLPRFCRKSQAGDGFMTGQRRLALPNPAALSDSSPAPAILPQN
jgi:hypothetical protein